jgi:hypothetical protein
VGHVPVDETTGLHWDENTAPQRVSSAINTGNLTWDGALVTAAAPLFLSKQAELVVPFGGGSLEGGAASFGAPLTSGGVTAQAVVVNDGVAATLTRMPARRRSSMRARSPARSR